MPLMVVICFFLDCTSCLYLGICVSNCRSLLEASPHRHTAFPDPCS
jgi:hypothetical protein